MELQIKIDLFKDIDSQVFLNHDFASKNFISIKKVFEDTFSLFEEMLHISYEKESFPKKLREQVFQIVSEFSDFYKQNLSYSFEINDSQFRRQRAMIQNINKWNDESYLGFNSPFRNKIVTIYNTTMNIHHQK